MQNSPEKRIAFARCALPELIILYDNAVDPMRQPKKI